MSITVLFFESAMPARTEQRMMQLVLLAGTRISSLAFPSNVARFRNKVPWAVRGTDGVNNSPTCNMARISHGLAYLADGTYNAYFGLKQEDLMCDWTPQGFEWTHSRFK